MKILVTGGCGYIGSHTVIELLNNNYEVVVIDNFSNSKEDTVNKIKKITNKNFDLYNADVKDISILDKIFTDHKINAVIHFAAHKIVGESIKEPLKYYRNNIDTTLSLCEIMNKYSVKKFVFSSSANVYGNSKKQPVKETFPTAEATSPYGETKLINERILKDLYISDNTWNIALLRYFNPIGAHSSGLIGDNPEGIPTNIMPYINGVAIGKYKELSVFGSDYETVDGTGLRDYIHVVDLAKGHIKALEWVLNNNGIDTFNLGTGQGYTVLQLIDAFEKINNIKIPYKITSRRPGDIPICYADVNHAKEVLNWQTKYTINDMVKDSYNFIKKQSSK